MKSSLLKSYVVSESKTYGLYCVERNHLRKYQKFVEIGDFASFNAAKSYLERNRKSLSKKIKTAPINYSEPVFTKKEIKQRVRYGNNFNYNRQNGPVIVTKEAKKTSKYKNTSNYKKISKPKSTPKLKKQKEQNDFSLFDFHKQQAINSRILKEISNSQEIIKDYVLIKIYKNSKNKYCSKSITKRFKSNSEESLRTNLLNYCSKFNITIISEIKYQS